MHSFCAYPKQCPRQYECARNFDIWRGLAPEQKEFRMYVSPVDVPCPGFEAVVLQSKPERK